MTVPHEIKLIDEQTDLSNVKPLDWDLVIGHKPFYVARVRGYNHCIKGYGEPIDLWCWPRDEMPTCDNMAEYDLDCPVAWGIEYKEKRRFSVKWGECEVRNGAHTIITRNGEPFYTIGGGRNYSVLKAMVLVGEIQQHPLDFNTIDFDKKMVGRKIWWHSQPGIITRYIKGQCCIMVEPDGMEHFRKPAEYEGDELFGDWYEERDVKLDCLVDGNINWFRG